MCSLVYGNAQEKFDRQGKRAEDVAGSAYEMKSDFDPDTGAVFEDRNDACA
jgi:hypothetical protein